MCLSNPGRADGAAHRRCSVTDTFQNRDTLSVCMVATTTVAVAAGVAGALLIAVAYLLYAFGSYRHAQEQGVVDMHDYQDVRLQILSANAVDNLVDESTEEVEEEEDGGQQ